MKIRLSLVVISFAFAVLSAFGADTPSYFAVYHGDDSYLTYSYDDLPSVLSSLSPSVNLSYDASEEAFVSPDWGVVVYQIPESAYNYNISRFNYVPYSSDPAYDSPTPSGPPSGGGVSPSSGGSGSGGSGGSGSGSGGEGSGSGGEGSGGSGGSGSGGSGGEGSGGDGVFDGSSVLGGVADLLTSVALGCAAVFAVCASLYLLLLVWRIFRRGSLGF